MQSATIQRVAGTPASNRLLLPHLTLLLPPFNPQPFHLQPVLYIQTHLTTAPYRLGVCSRIRSKEHIYARNTASAATPILKDSSWSRQQAVHREMQSEVRASSFGAYSWRFRDKAKLVAKHYHVPASSTSLRPETGLLPCRPPSSSGLNSHKQQPCEDQSWLTALDHGYLPCSD